MDACEHIGKREVAEDGLIVEGEGEIEEEVDGEPNVLCAERVGCLLRRARVKRQNGASGGHRATKESEEKVAKLEKKTVAGEADMICRRRQNAAAQHRHQAQPQRTTQWYETYAVA